MSYVSWNSLIFCRINFGELIFFSPLYRECLDSMVNIFLQLDRPHFLIVIPSDLEIIRVKRLQLDVMMVLHALLKLN